MRRSLLKIPARPVALAGGFVKEDRTEETSLSPCIENAEESDPVGDFLNAF
jgi:hypothetical protein